MSKFGVLSVSNVGITVYMKYVDFYNQAQLAIYNTNVVAMVSCIMNMQD